MFQSNGFDFKDKQTHIRPVAEQDSLPEIVLFLSEAF